MRLWHARVLLVFLLLGLAGCGTGSAAGPTAAATAAGTATRPDGNVGSLAMGTLGLDGTNNAVDAAQAAELLPLWKAYRALLKSDATAPAELTALATQIRESMEPAQIEAIETQTIGPEEQAALAARFGIEMAPMGGGLPEGMTEEDRAALMAEMQARVESDGTGGALERRANPGAGMGGGPGGFAPPEGAGIVGGAGGFQPPEGMQAEAGGGASVRAGGNAWISSLVDGLIAYLEGLA